MRYTLPIPALQTLINNLDKTISSEGIPFKRFLVLEKEGVVVIPSNSMFPVTEYHDYQIIDELEFRWLNGYWNLVINTEQ